MNAAIEIAGSDVVLWLSRVAHELAAELLVGCLLDDDTGDELVPIVALDLERNALVVAGGRRVPMARVRVGVIVDPRPGAPLVQAVLASQSPAEQREREERAALRRAGVDPDRLASPSDRHELLALIRSADAVPTYQARHAGYLALRGSADPELARFGARFFAALAERYAAAGHIPDDLHWRRTWFLRASGQLRDAVSVSDVLHTAGVNDAGDRKVLATVRAAALLDLFDLDGDGKWVSLADRAASEASAAGPPDEEAWNIHRRLNVARRKLRREP